MNERLGGRDYRFIAVCGLITAVSLWLAFRYFYRAFPEASINFQVTRDQSTPLGAEFLRARGFDTAGYRHNVTFDYDNRAKTFLEKEMGLERANELLASRIRIWRWRHRWFRPLQKEEFGVDLSPRGEVAGFRHEILEDAPGARLPLADARARAEDFLTKVMARDLGRLEFIQGTSQEWSHRTDHTFTWKDREFDFENSSYRFEVRIQGETVGGYREFLELPDKWIRDYDRLRSLNRLAGRVDSVLFVLLGLGMLGVFVLRIRQHDIKWRTALIFGAITAMLTLLALLNSFPVEEAGYDTKDSYGGFVTETLLYAVFSAVGSGAFIFLLTAIAETLYRERYKDKIALGYAFTWQGVRTKTFFLNVILGLTLTGFFVAYQIAVYLAANKLGAWAPAEVPYDDLLNTKIPWVFVLLGGFFPSVFEEFAFRMFSIPFAERFLRSKWAALVVAGFIWGFGHANYPNQPFYIRGIEVGIAGVILGWVMIRFGIVATLVWHYTVDAVYTAILLVRSQNPYLVFSGLLTALIMLIPLLVALSAYWKTGRFLPEAGLTNQDVGTCPPRIDEPEAPQAESLRGYRPLERRTILVAAGTVGALLLLLMAPMERFGSFVRFDMSKGEARVFAFENLRRLGFAVGESSTGPYRSVVYPESNFSPEVAKYVLQKNDIRRLNQLYANEIKGALWAVRLFRPLQHEEFTVFINPRSQSLYAYQHVLADDAPGADLSSEQAKDRAEVFLRDLGIDPSRFELKESSAEKRISRRDHTFIWEAKDGSPLNIGEAKYRLQILIQGDPVGRFSHELKLPEDWVRQYEKGTTLRTILKHSRTLTLAVFGVVALFLFVARARRGEIRWKATLLWACGISSVYLIDSLNDLPLAYQGYRTAEDLGVAQAGWLTFTAISLIIIFIAAAFAAGLMLALYPRVSELLQRARRDLWRRDAFIALVLGAGLLIALRQIAALAAFRFPAWATVSSLPMPDGLGSWSPFLANCSSVLFTTFFVLSGVGILVHLATQYLKRPLLIGAAALLVMVILSAGNSRGWGEFTFQMTLLTISLAAAILFARHLLRDNLLAYPSLAVGFLLLRSGYELSRQGAAELRYSGWALLGLLAFVVFWLVVRRSPNHVSPLS